MEATIFSILTTDLVEYDTKKHTSNVGGDHAIKEKTIISFIDLTSLNSLDSKRSISELCSKAQKFETAAVCVYPTFIEACIKHLKNSEVSVATVIGGFPHGQLPAKLKSQQAKYAIEAGANELDLVCNRSLIINKEFQQFYDEICEVRSCCKKEHVLKVILETGELSNKEHIKIASKLAIAAGADFIKTSTGKASTNATIEASAIMMLSIKEEFLRSGKMVGIKPAGGISDIEGAKKYIQLYKSILPEHPVAKSHFRFGASSLLDNIVGNTLSESNY